MHRHDRLGARGDRALGGRRVEVVRARVDVGEHRRRAALPDRVGRGDERERGHDDLVAGADARGVQREVQRGRAARHGHRVGGADALGEGLLELAHARALRDPAGGDDRRDGGALVPGQVRLGDRDVHWAPARLGARSARHHSTRPRRPASMSTSAVKPRSRAAAVVSASRRGTLVDGALGAELDLEALGAHHLEQHLGQLEQARLDAAGDVVDPVGHARLGGEDVGPRDLGDVDEVHRLGAVAEDQRRRALRDPLHPADQDLRVDAVDVHPRPVDVEVAERHVVEAVHGVEAAEQPLVEHLRRAVQRVVGIGVVRLRGRERLGQPVDRRRRRGDDLGDLVAHGGLEHVVGAVDHHVLGQPGLLRALRDADGRLVEDDVDALGQLVDERAIADVSVDHLHGAVGLGPCEVVAPPPDEVVQDHDVAGAGLDDEITQVRSDRAGAARDQDTGATQRSTHGRSTGRDPARFRGDLTSGRPRASPRPRGSAGARRSRRRRPRGSSPSRP